MCFKKITVSSDFQTGKLGLFSLLGIILDSNIAFKIGTSSKDDEFIAKLIDENIIFK